jgi:hypothetical protein
VGLGSAGRITSKQLGGRGAEMCRERFGFRLGSWATVVLLTTLVWVNPAMASQGSQGWMPLASTPPGIRDLAVDPRDPSVWYALAAESRRASALGFYMSIDGGLTWRQPGPFRAAHVSRLAVGADGGLHVVGQSRAARSTDGGQHWTQQNLSVGSSLAINPNNPAVLYAGGQFAGASAGTVFKSIDAGISWESVRLPWSCELSSIAIAPSATETVYVGGCGIAKSVDGGSTWQNLPNLPFASTGGLRVDPHNPDLLYALAQSGLWRSRNGGEEWNLLSSSPSPQKLFLDPRDPAGDSILTVGSPVVGGDWLRWSTDGGASWTIIGAPASRSLAPNQTEAEVRTILWVGDQLVVGTDSGFWKHPAPPLPWLIVTEATPVYSVSDDFLWTAQPGERYRIRQEEAGWALAVQAGSTPEWTVWLQLDNRVQRS